MPQFRVRYAQGQSADYAGGKIFSGLPAYLPVEAPDRAAAFVAAYRTFAKRGLDVTVLHAGYAEGQPLGFSPEEVSAIRAAGADLRDGYPHDGVQVERVEVL